jgi:predicted GNAT superfamily acetyltransferase
MPDIRVLTDPADYNQIPDLEIAVWGLPAKDVVSGNIIRAITLNGGVAHGAFDGGRMIGMALALVGLRGRKVILWSHMAAVLPELQGQGIGFALKQAQRDWALKQGYDEMRWTFDPIQRGNAHFNLHLLGSTSDIYHIDFYGSMADAINVSAPTDRLEAVWKLKDTRVKQLAVGDLPRDHRPSAFEASLLLRAEQDMPIACEVQQAPDFAYIQIPRHARTLDASMMHTWRYALRDALQSAFARGYRAIDLLEYDGGVFYVLERQSCYLLYVVECADKTLYTGIALDVQARLTQHNAGRGDAYTAARRPVRLLAAWSFPSRSAALKAEAAFKKLSRTQKSQHVSVQLPFLDGIPATI